MSFLQSSSWQTVFPDTHVVVPLFGIEGPTWKLNYRDAFFEAQPALLDDVPQNLTARVPGDVVSDLMLNRIIHDPYLDGYLWKEQDLWLGPQHKLDQDTNHSTKKAPYCKKTQTRIWSYSTTIELLDNEHYTDTTTTWQLVVESLQMGATIEWNGLFLANITDQFLRYMLELTPRHLQGGQKVDDKSRRHEIKITFDPTIETDGRFMAVAGGWDWAPYTGVCDAKNRRVFTMGIVEPIYLVAVDQFAITHVVPKVYYTGKLPQTPMKVHPEADFEVKLDVHLQFVNKTISTPELSNSYSLTASAEFAPNPQEQPVSLLPTNNGNEEVYSFTMRAHRNDVELWWPNGMGKQPLYNIQVGIIVAPHDNSSSTKAERLLKRRESSSHRSVIQKQIGFRTSALVTYNESEYNYENLAAEEGTGLHGMYLRINGALVMARGANIIPNDQLQGRYVHHHHGSSTISKGEQAYRVIVQSVAAAHMNILRVWGGGKVLPRTFYDACDEYGILIYHDQMLVSEDNHDPPQTPTMEHEVRHFVKSLSSHTSIVVWNGCNECQVVMGTPSEVYATFILKVVAQEDDTRSIWPNSPSSYGWKTGVNRVDCKPNGKPFATRNPAHHKDDPKLETHGPDMRAFSTTFPSVNGVDQHFPYPTKPRELSQDQIGPNHQNVFATEFGASMWSSFESVSGTLRPEHWGIHGGGPPDTCNFTEGYPNVCKGNNVMAQRNYPCDTAIEAYFGNSSITNSVGKSIFQAQLYQCVMAHTLWMRGEIKYRRSTNSFGLLIWQLNENWPTGGWGVIEYSGDSSEASVLPGQMLGGRWKPLMHLLKDSLFRDVFADCGPDWCFVRNDGMEQVNVSVTLEAWNIKSSFDRTAAVPTYSFETSLPGGISSTVRFHPPKSWGSEQYDAIIIRASDATDGSVLMEDSVFLWHLPKSLPNLVASKVSVSVDSVKTDAKGGAVVTLSSNALALYVVLTTLAPGRFEENAIVLRPRRQRLVLFVPLVVGENVDIELLRSSLRVEHLGSYFD